MLTNLIKEDEDDCGALVDVYFIISSFMFLIDMVLLVTIVI